MGPEIDTVEQALENSFVIRSLSKLSKMTMSKEAIRLAIKRKKLCDNPELVERVYLHNKGFTEIQNLDQYTEIKDLFLEGNELTKINGLDAQNHLEHLNLQKNQIGELL